MGSTANEALAKMVIIEKLLKGNKIEGDSKEQTKWKKYGTLWSGPTEGKEGKDDKDAKAREGFESFCRLAQEAKRLQDQMYLDKLNRRLESEGHTAAIAKTLTEAIDVVRKTVAVGLNIDAKPDDPLSLAENLCAKVNNIYTTHIAWADSIRDKKLGLLAALGSYLKTSAVSAPKNMLRWIGSFDIFQGIPSMVTRPVMGRLPDRTPGTLDEAATRAIADFIKFYNDNSDLRGMTLGRKREGRLNNYELDDLEDAPAFLHGTIKSRRLLQEEQQLIKTLDGKTEAERLAIFDSPIEYDKLVKDSKAAMKRISKQRMEGVEGYDEKYASELKEATKKARSDIKRMGDLRSLLQEKLEQGEQPNLAELEETTGESKADLLKAIEGSHTMILESGPEHTGKLAWNTKDGALSARRRPVVTTTAATTTTTVTATPMKTVPITGDTTTTTITTAPPPTRKRKATTEMGETKDKKTKRKGGGRSRRRRDRRKRKRTRMLRRRKHGKKKTLKRRRKRRHRRRTIRRR